MKSPDAALKEEFTDLTSLRELRDHRVILADRREQRIVVADFSTGRVERIGRQGQGPGEYGAVDRVFPMRGDSSLMAIFFQRRWLLFADARIVQTVAPNAPAVQATQGRIRGADDLTSVLAYSSSNRASPNAVAASDSFAAILVDRATGHVDTITRLQRKPELLSRGV